MLVRVTVRPQRVSLQEMNSEIVCPTPRKIMLNVTYRGSTAIQSNAA